MKTLLAALTLIVMSPALAELTTSSTLLINFFQLNTFFLLVVFAYGLPVLVLREFAVRLQLNYLGVFFFGIAFGMYSEGFIAKTLILSSGLPAPAYNNYGYIFGVSIPFAVAISVWHAVAAVVLPIFFTHYLFAQKESTSWLPKWLSLLLGCALIFIGSANFLNGDKGVPGTIPALITLLVLMSLAVITGYILGKRKLILQEISPERNRKPFSLGFLAIVYFGFTFLAALHIPVVIFFSILFISLYVYYKKFLSWVITQEDYLLFGCGFYLQQAFIAIFLRLTGGVTSFFTAVVPSTIFALCVLIAVKRIMRKSSG